MALPVGLERALKAHTREEMAAVTGYAERGIGNATRDRVDDLVALDPGLRPGRRPLREPISVTGSNWKFFLDQAMCAVYR